MLQGRSGPVRVGAALLCACTGVDAPARSEAPPDPVVSDHWALGEPVGCDAPGAPGWVDASDRVGGSTPHAGPLDEAGSVALWESEGVWHLVASQPSGTLATGTVDGGGLAPLTLPAPAAHTRVADLDGDGVVDLLAWSDAILQLPGVDPAAATVLFPPDPERPVVDVEVGDLDDDGRDDLLAVWHDDVEDTESGVYSPPSLALGTPEGFAPLADVVPGDTAWGAAFDVTTLDWDDDGDLDAYLCFDGPTRQPNRPLCDRDGSLGACDAAGADVAVFCMGTSVGDVDGDAEPDLYLTASGAHRLLLGSADGYYDATATEVGLAFEAGQMGWGSSIVDLDNDGRADILAATADFTAGPGRWPLWVLAQESDGVFTDVGAALGFPRAAGGRGVLTHDLNGDGVVDVLMGDMARPPWLFLSQGCTAAGWIEVDAPHGSWVEVEAGGQVWGALASEAPGFGATGPARVHVGLGETAVVDRVRVHVPGYGADVLEGPVAARRRVVWRAPGG